MANSSKDFLYLVGTLLLVHSGYSSFEFHKLTASTHKQHSLPLDISLEAVVGFIIILVGAITSIENPKYLSVEDKIISEESRYLKPIEMKNAVQLGEQLGLADYSDLENRVAFIDVRRIRGEYADWAVKQNSEKKTE
ncbi:uncharacterized protein LODBEIA_P10150 [Lodderomyces beijingensis]|uniref:Uncharacterized protein n=1 Tax=Lodderomyces beijingensis TaxID=1775926 RepID=A0ABP0ZF43_9ASCO